MQLSTVALVTWKASEPYSGLCTHAAPVRV